MKRSWDELRQEAGMNSDGTWVKRIKRQQTTIHRHELERSGDRDRQWWNQGTSMSLDRFLCERAKLHLLLTEYADVWSSDLTDLTAHYIAPFPAAHFLKRKTIMHPAGIFLLPALPLSAIDLHLEALTCQHVGWSNRVSIVFEQVGVLRFEVLAHLHWVKSASLSFTLVNRDEVHLLAQMLEVIRRAWSLLVGGGYIGQRLSIQQEIAELWHWVMGATTTPIQCDSNANIYSSPFKWEVSPIVNLTLQLVNFGPLPRPQNEKLITRPTFVAEYFSPLPPLSSPPFPPSSTSSTSSTSRPFIR
jgi:hypothetical protein